MIFSDTSETLAVSKAIVENSLESFAVFQAKLDFEQAESNLKQLHFEITLMEQEAYEAKIELYEAKLKLRLLL
ncbi:MAG: gp58-like family protein [Nitrosopumilus sp.]|nr:gp58-like family protein [Nitrosopumilus sp.]